MKSFKLKKNTVYVLAVFIIFISLIIVTKSYYRIQNKIYNQMLTNYTEQIEEQTSQIINTIHLELEYSALVLGSISEAKNLDLENKEKLLEELKNIKHRGYFTSLGMMDKDGNVFDTKGNYQKIDKKLFLDNLRISKTGSKYYVSDVLPTKKNNKEEILVAIPLYEKENYKGLLFGYYPILKIAKEIDYSKGQQYFQITDTNGRYISRSFSKNSFARDELTLWEEMARYKFFNGNSVETIKKNVEEGKKGVFYFEFQNKRRYVVYEPLGINKWHIFSTFTKKGLNDKAKHFQDISKELLFYLVGLKFILSFVIIGTAFIIYKSIKTQSSRLEFKNKVFKMFANKTKDIFFEINLPEKIINLYGATEQNEEFTFPLEIFSPEKMLADKRINRENYTLYKDFYIKILSNEKIENQVIQVKKAGEWRWFHVNAVFFVDSIVGVLEDFTEERKQEVELIEINEKSKYDFLTGLYNRETFEKEFEKFINKDYDPNKISAIFLLDLDNFKKINDTFGHGIGDVVLKETSNILKASLRECDSLGRLGGDEFIILIQNVNTLKEIYKIAKRLNNALTKIYTKDNQSITLSASIGIAEIRKEKSLKETFEKADKALYKVKFGGKNSYFMEEKSFN